MWTKLKRLARSTAGLGLRTAVVFLILEVILRIVSFFWFDQSSYYLLYGFHGAAGRVSVSPWSVYDGEHFKYPPNYTLEGAAGQADETATTNSLGFRGPDFEPEKPDGTRRIICMGGSSTFGFHNSDEGTYPRHLAKLMAKERGDVEVINAGFPYYNTACIRSLLESEVVDYEPDVLTLYTAYNDASWPLEVQPLARLLFWVQEHAVSYALLKKSILTDQRVYKLKRKVAGKVDHYDEARARDEIEQVARRYRTNVEAILDLAAARGIRVVMIKQPVTCLSGKDEVTSMTYEEEYRSVLRRFEKHELLSEMDLRLLRHHRLVEISSQLANERGLPVVDNIAITDRDRRRLASWVHLTEEANLRLAEAIRDAVTPLLPPPHEAAAKH